MPNEIRRYATPEAYRRALEERVAQLARAARRPINRYRQLLLFERYLLRLQAEYGPALLVKGGVALELQLARGRTTVDIDVRLSGNADDVLVRLRRAGAQDG